MFKCSLFYIPFSNSYILALICVRIRKLTGRMGNEERKEGNKGKMGAGRGQGRRNKGRKKRKKGRKLKGKKSIHTFSRIKVYVKVNR